MLKMAPKPGGVLGRERRRGGLRRGTYGSIGSPRGGQRDEQRSVIVLSTFARECMFFRLLEDF